MDKKVLYGAAGLCLVFAILMAGCVNTPAEDGKKTYVVGIDAEYPPFSYLGDNSEFVGFDVDSVKWIAEQKGFNVKIQGVAWDGIIPALQTGKIDMVYSGMSITPDRLEKVNFTIPYWQVNQGIAVKTGSNVTMDQFTNATVVIGVQRSCSADQWMQKAKDEGGLFGEEKYNQLVKDGKIKLFDSFPMSMVALEQGLVDAVIFDDVNIESYIQGKPQFTMLDAIETGEYYAVAVRKDDNDLRELMNAGLKDLMASEKWKELIAQYIVEDAAEPTVEPTANGTVVANTTPVNTTAPVATETTA
ncbi:transporter substrate-binding domain-containing protein [Methanocorpusculum vombati]|uniref:Transporter substrate-binding domain-containing protein n=1 Tax=Methanocorpusculum vombati TaxID=3002864 RepID=A0ABT4IKU4_9EURY|nr:transporter substrate-binding domain-containing protein [Methanocorpusculum vombati]MCZ9318753.1 transporter substrate-binding domain-containing protein [Methanocorpusculum sp.]MCZ0861867.1 transporter substrate-binding domain-containing protein [Methanocorpusculum vombati]MDE2521163.1 transporter substrate-binding domain-containing protein [Methanocorpusculum sp.]MDE2534900.1 transporter substrate-binding domain-containing protein [Methanocorpusculum sp.]MDE2545447.1 transporter substrate-